LQERGADVLFLEAHYTEQDLKAAREECKGMTGANPNQVPVVKFEPEQSSAATQAAPQSSASSEPSLSVDSTPQGADIEVDGAFVGNTPSTVPFAPGSHEISVKKKGFVDWTRKMNFRGGSVHLNAELEKNPGS
jgi:hypothetical protein